MQIVIDIPQEYYEIIKNQSQYIEEVGRILQDAAYNGIVLPEHHGKIYDENELKKYIIRDDCIEGCGYIDERDLIDIPAILEATESIDKVDREPTVSRFKCRAEQGGYCERWQRECVSWEHCELSSCNFPCPGCVMSSPLEREECDSCKWKDEKQKHYQS